MGRQSKLVALSKAAAYAAVQLIRSASVAGSSFMARHDQAPIAGAVNSP
jgi:hypothetical protein